MKISVIIPVYNVEDYLEECIESVIKQSYANKEILLINDGSTDRSQEICKSYSERYPEIHLITKKNKGLSDTRNRGIQQSEGDYLLFLDSDDYWATDFLDELVELVKEAQSPDYIFFRHQTYKQKSQQFEEHQLALRPEEVLGKTGLEALKIVLERHPNYDWFAWRGLIKKDFLIKHDLYFEEGRNYEDALWTPAVFIHAKKIAYYDEPVYVYRLEREGQITSTINAKNLLDSIYIAQYWESYLKDKTIEAETKQAILENTTIRYFYALWFSGFVKLSDRIQVIKELEGKKQLIQYTYSLTTKVSAYLVKHLGVSKTSSVFKWLINAKRKLSNN